MYTMLSLQHVSTVHYFRVAFLFSFWVFYFAKANDPPNVFDVTHYGADVDREDNKAVSDNSPFSQFRCRIFLLFFKLRAKIRV